MTKKKLALLTCDQLNGLCVDEQVLALAIDQSSTYEYEAHTWNSNTDWTKFDAVLIRNTWDYHEHTEEFLAVLKKIESSGVKLLNSSAVVEWNYHKGYLKELEKKGVKIVPTEMFTDLPKIPADWKGDRFIIKPAISATAWKTYIVTRAEIESGEVKKYLHPADWMLQPFLEEIREGEISLHYFNKKFSHSIIKLPKSGDFRVQEEHGGVFKAFEASPDLIKAGEEMLEATPFPLLYGRVDVVAKDKDYLLMELELIEPTLNFRKSSEAASKFLKALDQFFL